MNIERTEPIPLIGVVRDSLILSDVGLEFPPPSFEVAPFGFSRVVLALASRAVKFWRAEQRQLPGGFRQG
ncbi:hypothetical protein, partial [Zavarzinella formosa]|uniref:hypothetical protein n=1 Tax=Zavarzinella formosa TaxID=360055 RepID=UPI001EE652B7